MKTDFLTPTLRRWLCNTLIQPHFDYVCSAWYPNLKQKIEKQNPDFSDQMHTFLPTASDR